MIYAVKKTNYKNKNLCETMICQKEAAYVFQILGTVLNNGNNLLLKNKIIDNLETLTSSEEKIIRYFWGIDEEEIDDLQILSDKMGISKIEVYHKLQEAFRKLKHPTRSMAIRRIINKIDETENNEYIDCKQILIDKLTEYMKDWNFENNVILYNIFKRNHIELSSEKIIDLPPSSIYTNESIENMDFSVRTYNCLKRAGIEQITELLEKTDEELLKIRNLGRKSAQEVKQKIARIEKKRLLKKYKIINNGVTTYYKISIDYDETDNIPSLLFDEIFALNNKKNIITGPIKLFSEVNFFLMMQGYIYYEDIEKNIDYLNQLINELNITKNKDYLLNKFECYHSDIILISKDIYNKIIKKNNEGIISIDEFNKMKESYDKGLDKIVDRIDSHSILKEFEKLVQYDIYNKDMSDISDFYDFSYIQEELNKKDIQIFKPIDYFKEQADKIFKKSLSDELQDNLDELMDDPFLADQITLYKYIKRNIDANYMNKDAEILKILFK